MLPSPSGRASRGASTVPSRRQGWRTSEAQTSQIAKLGTARLGCAQGGSLVRRTSDRVGVPTVRFKAFAGGHTRNGGAWPPPCNVPAGRRLVTGGSSGRVAEVEPIREW
jgi:hypothetical protein